jgi:carbamoyltransferase
MAPRYVLGISAFYHDSAAALLADGEIVAAAQEERFTRKKGDASFPHQAVAYCLEEAGITIDGVDHVAFYDKPILKFDRILETYLGVAPRGFRSFLVAGPLWIKEKLFTDGLIKEALDYHGPVLYAEHHESHAASAFFPSPFREAAILTVDGVGEWATTTIGAGSGTDIEILREIHWPDSLGLLYSAFTYYTGFKVNSGEYKVMGLAPYGRPKYVDLIHRHLIEVREDGSFRLDQKYFNYLSGLTMTSEAFHDLFEGPPRRPESPLTQKEMDLARSVQEVTEDVLLRLARTARRETGLTDLCMAGGVALNCVANGRILREGPFERIWVQPASGDAGGALGVAQLVWHRHCGGQRGPHASLDDATLAGEAGTRPMDGMRGAYLGPGYPPEDIEAFLTRRSAPAFRMEPATLIPEVARLLAEGNVVGWFKGRMEYGPRALGARSILGDARSPDMQSQMNLKIKFREGFRPFAPSVLRERVHEYFELDADSPYMLLVASVREARRLDLAKEQEALWGIERMKVPRSDIPAVTHVDYSARIQTVHRETNPEYHALLVEFERRTGCGVIMNTSFNVRGEPIVCTPDDAYRCFMRTNMDFLVLWPFLLSKADQPFWEETDEWTTEFALD